MGRFAEGPLAGTCDVSCNFCGTASAAIAAPAADEPLLLCFDVACPAPILTEYSREGEGVVTEIGTCAPGGALDSICRLGCSEGYQATNIIEGRCLPRWFARDEVATAEYVGQNVTCVPEMNHDGSMGESWCRMEKNEALRNCCASAGNAEAACLASGPQACELACAEVWLPLSRSCEQYLAADQVLTTRCEDVASAFLVVAPATVQISGFVCHPSADGRYHIGRRTVGGKPHWLKLPTESGGPTLYLYAVVEPHSGYAIGESLSSYIAWLETYENLPPVSRKHFLPCSCPPRAAHCSLLCMQWGENSWHEVCSTDSSVDQLRLALLPGFSNKNCAEYLQLQSGELTEACCSPGDSFEALLAAGSAPTECGWDCAHIWCGGRAPSPPPAHRILMLGRSAA